jgi:hypothetical protein
LSPSSSSTAYVSTGVAVATAVACRRILGENGRGEIRSKIGKREDDHEGKEPARHNYGEGRNEHGVRAFTCERERFKLKDVMDLNKYAALS